MRSWDMRWLITMEQSYALDWGRIAFITKHTQADDRMCELFCNGRVLLSVYARVYATSYA